MDVGNLISCSSAFSKTSLNIWKFTVHVLLKPAAAAAAAKSLQSCPTLCNPRDSSPPGSPVPWILQARTLEWVVISFSIIFYVVLYKILQTRLQQYMNHELPDVQAGFRKGRGTRNQIANIHWIIKKAREFQKNIYFCFIDYAKAFDCGS